MLGTRRIPVSLGFALVVLAVALAMAIVKNGSATAEDAATCEPLNGFKPDGLRTETEESGEKSETTQFFEGGRYEVTRCNAEGTLLQSQVVGPIAVPNGGTAMVPLMTTVKRGEAHIVTPILYGTPEHEGWSAVWEKHGDEAQARVLPPTRGISE